MANSRTHQDKEDSPGEFAGAPAAPLRVNPTLSRGLATRALAVLGAQGTRYCDGLRAALRPGKRGKKTVARVRQELTLLGERAKLIQVIGSTPNARQVTVCQFVPEVAHADARRSAFVRFKLCQFVVTCNGTRLGPDFGTALLATDHAIERLFLRLNTLDPGAVLEELHDAMLLALPLWAIGLALDLRQLPLPTSSGAFLCDLDPDRPHLAAKTWLSTEHLAQGRWAPVVGDLGGAVASAGGHASLATAVCTGIAQWLDDEGRSAFDELVEALSGRSWLREPYAPRADPLGEAWMQHHNESSASCRSGLA